MYIKNNNLCTIDNVDNVCFAFASHCIVCGLGWSGVLKLDPIRMFLLQELGHSTSNEIPRQPPATRQFEMDGWILDFDP